MNSSLEIALGSKEMTCNRTSYDGFKLVSWTLARLGSTEFLGHHSAERDYFVGKKGPGLRLIASEILITRRQMIAGWVSQIASWPLVRTFRCFALSCLFSLIV